MRAEQCTVMRAGGSGGASVQCTLEAELKNAVDLIWLCSRLISVSSSYLSQILQENVAPIGCQYKNPTNLIILCSVQHLSKAGHSFQVHLSWISPMLGQCQYEGDTNYSVLKPHRKGTVCCGIPFDDSRSMKSNKKYSSWRQNLKKKKHFDLIFWVIW